MFFSLLAAAGTAAAQDAPAEVRVVGDADGRVQIRDGDRLLLSYRATGHEWKAHAERLRTPSGTDVLRDSPSDHVHHRGLIFALGADEYDYWGEQYVENPGRQRGLPLTEITARASATEREAAFLHEVEWIAGDPAETRLRERRTIAVRPGADATVVTWISELAVPQGRAPVRLWGRHYFGLGLRFVATMDEDGTFSSASDDPGTVVRGDERLRRATWCAYTADAGEGPVTVAMFDHPDNARHPATWFTMAQPFAFLGATLDLAEQPLELGTDAPLRLCYGVAAWDGAVGRARIDQEYRRWLATCARASANEGRTKESEERR